MHEDQREQNPDVNSFNPDPGPGESEENEPQRDSDSDIERPDRDEEIVPVPPDVQPTAPIEEPPTNDAPVGDVDDSPKQIADG